MSHRMPARQVRLGGFLAVLFAAAVSGRGQQAVPLTQPAGTVAAAGAVDLKYSFGPLAISGYTHVTPQDSYGPDHPYGYDLWSKAVVIAKPGESDPLKAGCASGANGRPFFFSAKLGPGAYQVKVTLGDPNVASTTTVKSETRRLMLEDARVDAGQTRTFTFLVHVRVPQLPDGQVVAFKPRESLPILYVRWGTEDHTFTELDWDEKLTLEFAGPHPALCSVEITPADHPVTIYLIGDSTMTDQMMEPWTAWGQQFPRWFVPPVLIANYAECGETTASFLGERRWPKVLSEIHPGDWVFMEFGINDRSMQVARFSQYFVQFIADTRAHGATPVLVTPQNLRQMTGGKVVQSLAAQVEAIRQVARDQNVGLIDLNNMSTELYEALGPAIEPKAFVDGTHHSEYGAYELAKCVVQGVIDQKLPMAQYVVPQWKTFDPAHPDAIDAMHLVVDPQLDPARPGGPGLIGQGPMAAPIAAGGARGRSGAPAATTGPTTTSAGR